MVMDGLSYEAVTHWCMNSYPLNVRLFQCKESK